MGIENRYGYDMYSIVMGVGVQTVLTSWSVSEVV